MRSIFGMAVFGLCCLAVVAAERPASQATGDVTGGKAFFEGAGDCLRCHAVDDRGGSLGPDLSWIGVLRTPDTLRRALTDPSAQVAGRYLTIVVETAGGQTIEGIRVNEDDYSIQLRDTRGELRSFIKSQLKSFRAEPRSLMPSYAKLSAADLDGLVTYLTTLRRMWAIEPGERTRDIAPTTGNDAFFNRPERDAEERPELLIAALDIPRGATVADIGSGTGYFTWRLAQQVGPKGKVLAVDVQRRMLDLTREAVARHALDNVEYVLAAENAPGLPERALDLVFIAYSYHEFADPELVLAAVRRSLKPGGRMVILEYAKESNIAPAAPLHKMSFEEIRREIEPAGFTIDRLLDFLPLQHGVIFTIK